jgi:hypothetical protein
VCTTAVPTLFRHPLLSRLPRKEARPLSHALDIRLIQHFDSSALGLVRRWLLIGYFPIHLLSPASRRKLTGEGVGSALQLGAWRAPASTSAMRVSLRAGNSRGVRMSAGEPVRGCLRSLPSDVAVANRDGRDSGWESELTRPFRDARRFPLYTLVARGYAYDVGVWDLSIVQGPFSVAPCQTLIVRFATS